MTPPSRRSNAQTIRPTGRTPPADNTEQSRRDQIEPRSREEYYEERRTATESPERTELADRSEPNEPTENGQQAHPGSNWEETAELGRRM